MSNIIYEEMLLKERITCLIVIILIIIILITYKKTKMFKAKRTLFIIGTIVIISILYIFINTLNIGNVFRHSSPEKAFLFEYPSGKILGSKKYKDTVFAYGTTNYNSKNDFSSPNIFTSYIRDGKKWKCIGLNSINTNKRRAICDENKQKYYVYKYSNEKDNVTGIFIYEHVPVNEKTLTKETIITDSINTDFKYLDTVTSPIDKKVTVIFLGVVEEKIKKDYYISIDKTKYKLKDIEENWIC